MGEGGHAMLSTGDRERVMSPPVLGLAGDTASATSFWRIVAPLSRLRQHRAVARWAMYDAGELRLSPEDVVVMARAHPKPGPNGRRDMTERMIEPIRQHSAAIVYDVDDDLFSDEYVEHHIATRWHDGKSRADMRQQISDARWAVNQCDGVTVTTPALATVVQSFTGLPVVVVPNAIDVRWFGSRVAHRPLWADVLTIGWAGGRRPMGDFGPLAEAWRRVAARRSDVLFVVVGDDSAGRLVRDLPSGQYEHAGFVNVDDYPMALQVDIGCCAVADDAFNRSKTPIKAWEYALAGAAVVATPTLYGDDVDGRLTGLLAETADDWEVAIMDLVSSARRRQLFSLALRARVERLHALDTSLVAWPTAWNTILASKRAQGYARTEPAAIGAKA